MDRQPDRPTDDEIAAMQDALWHIRAWCRAYPVEMFDEPDLTAARAKLGDAEMGRLHASWARHILSGITRYVDAGLPRQETVQ
jgi:hypothetical protein